MMKKFIYIILFACFLFSCGENDYTYDGKQFFTLGYSDTTKVFSVDEEITNYQLPFGLAYPADKDYEFTVSIKENEAGNMISLNGKNTGDDFTVNIRKGQQMGYINIEADFDAMKTGVPYVLKLTLKDKGTSDYIINGSETKLTIQKFCTLTSERMKEWEGIYKEKGKSYEMTVKHVNGDTLSIENIWGYNLYPQAELAPLKVVLDYSTKKYTVSVVNQYLYKESDGTPAYIRNNINGTPIDPKGIDFCTKTMSLYFVLLISNQYYGYYTLTMERQRGLP